MEAEDDELTRSKGGADPSELQPAVVTQLLLGRTPRSYFYRNGGRRVVVRLEQAVLGFTTGRRFTRASVFQYVPEKTIPGEISRRCLLHGGLPAPISG